MQVRLSASVYHLYVKCWRGDNARAKVISPALKRWIIPWGIENITPRNSCITNPDDIPSSDLGLRVQGKQAKGSAFPCSEMCFFPGPLRQQWQSVKMRISSMRGQVCWHRVLQAVFISFLPAQLKFPGVTRSLLNQGRAQFHIGLTRLVFKAVTTAGGCPNCPRSPFSRPVALQNFLLWWKYTVY